MKNVVVFVVVLYKQTNLYYMFKLLIHLCLLHISYAHLSDLKNIEYVVLKNKKYNKLIMDYFFFVLIKFGLI